MGHPSSVLRMREKEELGELVADLRRAAAFLRK
jgi:hypothetical protein